MLRTTHYRASLVAKTKASLNLFHWLLAAKSYLIQTPFSENVSTIINYFSNHCSSWWYWLEMSDRGEHNGTRMLILYHSTLLKREIQFLLAGGKTKRAFPRIPLHSCLEW